MRAKFIAILSVLTLAALPIAANADGLTNIPYSQSFENHGIGPVTNEPGWYHEDERTKGVVVVTNANDHGMRSPYVPLPLPTHSNVLSIAGSISCGVVPDPSINYAYVDMLVRPQHRNEAPGDYMPDSAKSLRPQIAAYINSNSNLVFFHTLYNANSYQLNDSFEPCWTTNNTDIIPSNEWVRLTITLTYDSSEGYYIPYYRIQVNGGAPFSSPQGYSVPCLANYYDLLYPDGGTWFMTGDQPQGYAHDWISSLTINGYAQLDDLTITTNPPPSVTVSVADTSVTEGNAGTTNAVFALSLSSPWWAPVSVDYVTSNGTAIAGSDYQAAAGTATIGAGLMTGSISIAVYGDTTPEGISENFYIRLSNPTNAVIAITQAVCVVWGDEAQAFTTNGTPHAWLDAYSLVTGGDYVGADTNDVDLDGMFAYEEYWAGTCPTNKESVFKIVSVSTNFMIRWLGGTNLSNPDFIILRSTNLTSPDPWALPSVAFPRTNGIDGTNLWVDTNAHLYAPSVFYRLTAPTNTP